MKEGSSQRRIYQRLSRMSMRLANKINNIRFVGESLEIVKPRGISMYSYYPEDKVLIIELWKEDYIKLVNTEPLRFEFAEWQRLNDLEIIGGNYCGEIFQIKFLLNHDNK